MRHQPTIDELTAQREDLYKRMSEAEQLVKMAQVDIDDFQENAIQAPQRVRENVLRPKVDARARYIQTATDARQALQQIDARIGRAYQDQAKAECAELLTQRAALVKQLATVCDKLDAAALVGRGLWSEVCDLYRQISTIDYQVTRRGAARPPSITQPAWALKNRVLWIQQQAFEDSEYARQASFNGPYNPARATLRDAMNIS